MGGRTLNHIFVKLLKKISCSGTKFSRLTFWNFYMKLLCVAKKCHAINITRVYV
jgi:hypothetical protein